MDINLSAKQARVIGCLIEKEITTPDQYPLSLNALTNACNQKSNREPVMSLDEATVRQTLDELIKDYLVVDKSVFGSRTTKFQHRFCNTEIGTLKFSEQELGIVCVLLLRGPQTPGELRTRTNRLCKFSDVQEVETVLQTLSSRQDGPFVVQLAREPGKRESRYAHLFSGEVDVGALPSSVPVQESTSQGDRLVRLEQRVDDLQSQIDELRKLLEELTAP